MTKEEAQIKEKRATILGIALGTMLSIMSIPSIHSTVLNFITSILS